MVLLARTLERSEQLETSEQSLSVQIEQLTLSEQVKHLASEHLIANSTRANHSLVNISVNKSKIVMPILLDAISVPERFVNSRKLAKQLLLLTDLLLYLVYRRH